MAVSDKEIQSGVQRVEEEKSSHCRQKAEATPLHPPRFPRHLGKKLRGLVMGRKHRALCFAAVSMTTFAPSLEETGFLLKLAAFVKVLTGMPPSTPLPAEAQREVGQILRSRDQHSVLGSGVDRVDV